MNVVEMIVVFGAAKAVDSDSQNLRGLHPLTPLWLTAPAACAMSALSRVAPHIEDSASMSQYAEIDGFAYTIQAEGPP